MILAKRELFRQWNRLALGALKLSGATAVTKASLASAQHGPGEIEDDCQCPDYISRRYSHPLSDQHAANRRPSQADRARRGDHPRRTVAAEVHCGVLKPIRAANESPGEFAGAFFTYLKSAQRLEPVVDVPVDLILGVPVALLQLAFQLLATAFDHV